MKLKVPQLGRKSKSSKKKLTRRDDAASIVGEELAEELEAKNSRLGVRSYHAMVEMSQTANTVNLVQQFLYPKSFSAKAAVAKSLGIKPKQETKPLSVKQIVRNSVGLAETDRRKALGNWVHAQIVRGMGVDLPVINEGSVKNVVRKSTGLQPVVENKSKPKSVREVVKQSVGLR